MLRTLRLLAIRQKAQARSDMSLPLQLAVLDIAGVRLALIGFFVLSFASLVAAILRHSVAKGAPHATIDNLSARINAWWVMALLIGLSLWFGKAGVLLLFFFLSLQVLREFVTLTYTRRADHLALAAVFYGFLPLQYFLIWIGWYGFFSVMIPVYGFLLLPIISALRADTLRFLERVAVVQWAMMLAIYGLSHVPALTNLAIPGYTQTVLLVAFLIIVVQASDVLQYIWGKLFGRHKLAPTLSPSKTWEGLLGGVLSASALGASLWWITPFTPLHAALFALLITLLGFFGGLIMSAIKRDFGVKDWGHMISGHGGVLDRVDSLLFSAPAFFHLVHYLYVP
jgi:phosphatidate cytidylyltransferase